MRTIRVERKYYCGVDLHAKNLVACILRADGRRMCCKRMPNNMDSFLRCIEPYRDSIAIAVESTFNWYWFIDGCRANNLEIHLGHSYYMKSIYCDKRKNDRLDAEKIANLLRAGLLPEAHACAAPKRSVRDLLRRRNSLVYMRSDLLGYTRMSFYRQGDTATLSCELKNKSTRSSTVERFTDHNVRFGAEVEMGIVTELDTHIRRLEGHILEQANSHYREEMGLLQEIPGVGPIIAMTVLYETDCMSRFKRRQDYSSYCRLVKPVHTSDGKHTGSANRRCGNPHLKWAMMQIVSNAASNDERIARLYDSVKEKHHPLKARAIMANSFCTVIYHMLKHTQRFDIERFCRSFLEVDSLTPEAGVLHHAA